MLKGAIHCLLAVQLAGCPLFCRVPEEHEAAAAQATPTRSPASEDGCCAPGGCADGHSQAPAPFPECPCKTSAHDCICSGATVDATAFDLLIAVQPFDWMTKATGPVASRPVATPAVSFSACCLSAFDGRDMRGLLCSLLC